MVKTKSTIPSAPTLDHVANDSNDGAITVKLLNNLGDLGGEASVAPNVAVPPTRTPRQGGDGRKVVAPSNAAVRRTGTAPRSTVRTSGTTGNAISERESHLEDIQFLLWAHVILGILMLVILICAYNKSGLLRTYEEFLFGPLIATIVSSMVASCIAGGSSTSAAAAAPTALAIGFALGIQLFMGFVGFTLAIWGMVLSILDWGTDAAIGWSITFCVLYFLAIIAISIKTSCWFQFLVAKSRAISEA